MTTPPHPTFFADAAGFRAWLQLNHASATELWVGFWKKASGRPSLTWPESVDQALCFGWIDGVRRSLSEDAYAIRFTPRRPGSNWSAVNIRRAQELATLGLMEAAGAAAFAARDPARADRSLLEREQAALEPDEERLFQANQEAWAYFSSRPPSYRKPVLHWVVSAKRETTRRRRLEVLIRCSAERQPIQAMRRGGGGRA